MHPVNLLLAYCHIPVEKVFTTLANIMIEKNILTVLKQLPSIPALKTYHIVTSMDKKDRNIYILAGIRFVRYIELEPLNIPVFLRLFKEKWYSLTLNQFVSMNKPTYAYKPYIISFWP